MRANDRELFQSIFPNEMVSYVRGAGWKLERDIGRRGSLWLSKDEKSEIVIPSDNDLADYSLRIEEALLAILLIENRSLYSLLNDVKNTHSDVLRFRAIAAENGTLPFENAANFIGQCRSLILSAACSTWEPRPYYGPKKPHLATDFLDGVQMGQTERGSFVITALSPIRGAFQTSLFEEETGIPFERLAVKKLMSALAKVPPSIRSVMNTESYGAFEGAVQEGISANFCEALAGIVENSPKERLEIGVTWSAAYETPVLEPVRFTRGSIDVLYRAAERLREIEPTPDYELEGFVFKLSRDEGANKGQVTVFGEIDGITRRVKMSLATRQYNVAVRAHEEEKYITCAGDLKKTGRSWTLENIRSFRTLNS